MVVGSNLF